MIERLLAEFSIPESSDGYVYVLKLERGKWYVGWTKDLLRRLKLHWGGEGAKWTMKYMPVEIAGIVPGNLDIENWITELMSKRYGAGNVRGGTRCQCPDLTREEVTRLFDRRQFLN
jgi:predicted GIY-YIG superfamily endonuclease